MSQIKLRSIDIKGKDYVPVHERVRIFRTDKQFEGFRLVVSRVEVNTDFAFFEAQVLNNLGVLVANGHAMEWRSEGYINKTSYIENAETSAIGRALGSLGIGIDTAFSTADELLLALDAQENKKGEPKRSQGPDKADIDEISELMGRLTEGFTAKQKATSIHEALKVNTFTELKNSTNEVVKLRLKELRANCSHEYWILEFRSRMQLIK